MHLAILNTSFCYLHNLFGNFDLLVLKTVVTLPNKYSQGFKLDKQPPIQRLVRVCGWYMAHSGPLNGRTEVQLSQPKLLEARVSPQDYELTVVIHNNC